ncbi:hypothetical protein LEN26_001012 [Aphanomyces euteiches]|nr:hypothetical protein AeMF1_015364 [Aphanomyces euteiches]KAH9123043.1 hypothetical protein LEN26_010036 [Aphanomyces euteiches]KAH9162255.1 hypothetical protein LEN26_001012 [Aphanomyces euteiches]
MSRPAKKPRAQQMMVAEANKQLKIRYDAFLDRLLNATHPADDSEDDVSSPVVVCRFRKTLSESGKKNTKVISDAGSTFRWMPIWVALKSTWTILRQLQNIGGVDMGDTLLDRPSQTHEVGGISQRADRTMSSRQSVNTFPNIIIEICYLNGSWNTLVAKLHRWIGPETTVQVAIGVQVCTVRRRIIVMTRGNPQQVVDFDVNSHAIIPPAIFPSFPLHLIYHNGPLSAELAGHANDAIVLNLLTLRERIDEALARMLAAAAALAVTQ